MAGIKSKLSEMSVLLTGLAFTSRTETIEDYLKDKVGSMAVVSISSCFLKNNLSSCRVYEKGTLKETFKVPNLRLKNYAWYMQPFMPLVVLMYFVSITLCMRRLGKKYDLYIGVSHTFGLWGVVLKKLRLVQKVIYYCIDYYIPTPSLDFHMLFVRLLNSVDRFTVLRSDYVWDISSGIPLRRQEIGKMQLGSYRHSVVPLGYSRHLRRCKSFEETRRWEIGFVGSLTSNQGLQLLVETLPLVVPQFPELKVTVIGEGPYAAELKNLVSKANLDNRFHFYGFIKEENSMLDILSGCAVGVALYSMHGNENIKSADTGKPKLYALLGLPIITTNDYILHDELRRNKAGVAIAYNKEELRDAISYLMSSDERLKEYKANSYRFGERFISDSIFNNTFKELGFN